MRTIKYTGGDTEEITRRKFMDIYSATRNGTQEALMTKVMGWGWGTRAVFFFFFENYHIQSLKAFFMVLIINISMLALPNLL